MRDGAIFEEVQGFHQNRVALLIVAAVVIALAGAAGVVQLALPSRGSLVIVAIVAVAPLTIFALRMRTTVSEEALTVTMRPLIRRRVPIEQIDEVEAIRYSPLREGGGWGVRISASYGLVLNVSGGEGVRIVAGGKRYLIGSLRAEELAAAIEVAREAAAERAPAPAGGSGPIGP